MSDRWNGLRQLRRRIRRLRHRHKNCCYITQLCLCSVLSSLLLSSWSGLMINSSVVAATAAATAADSSIRITSDDDSSSDTLDNIGVGNEGFNDQVKDPERIVFGSCHSQLFDSSQMWEMIDSRHPTAFIWGGDTVYGDDRPPPPMDGDEEDNEQHPNTNRAQLEWRRRQGTPGHMRELYTALRNQPGYSKLVRNSDDGDADGSDGCHVFGTLDDHDYGVNNGDSTFQHKYGNSIEFVRFLGLLDDNIDGDGDDSLKNGGEQYDPKLPHYSSSSVMARRALDGKGVYGVQVYDFSRPSRSQRILSDEEAGIDPDVVPLPSSRNGSSNNNKGTEDHTVAVFVLDIRTNKTPWPRQIFHRDLDGDFLGEEQWRWFETALQRSYAAVNIIVSGLQVHPPFMANQVENWAGFPTAQHRLYQAVLKSGVSAPLFISGDVHMSQLLKKDCRRWVLDENDNTGGGGAPSSTSKQERRSLFEITTSGITHSWGSSDRSICGTPSKSWLCYFYPFNLWMGTIAHLAHHIIPLRSVISQTTRPTIEKSTASSAKAKTRNSLQYTLQRNVAELDFDFNERVVIVRILSETGNTLLYQNWSFDALNGHERTKEVGSSDEGTEILETPYDWSRRMDLQRNDDDFVCFSHRGEPTQVHFVLATITAVSILLIGVFYPILFVIGLVIAVFLRTRRRRGGAAVKHLKPIQNANASKSKND